MSAGLYIHIPFCRHKCLYCDFYSETDLHRMERFLYALHREMDRYAEHPLFSTTKIPTLYVGGGTPSLLSPDQLSHIIQHVNEVFQVSPQAEMSLEANPGTVLKDHLQGYVDAGISRLTLGVQSFVDAELSTLTRIHNSDTAIQAFQFARHCGIEDIGLDLIFGIPGQTLKSWSRSLQTALELRPEHLSIYGLTYEAGTPLTRLVEGGTVTRIDEELEREMFLLAKHTLESNGYEMYEISNYALPGKRSRHNQTYWDGRPYLGLGPSAHSFDGAQRWWNVAELSEYVSRLTSNQTAVQDRETLTRSQELEEMILLGLRRREGIDLNLWRSRSGFDLLPHAHEHFQQYGGIDTCPAFSNSSASRLLTHCSDELALTEPGLLLYDNIASLLFDTIS